MSDYRIGGFSAFRHEHGRTIPLDRQFPSYLTTVYGDQELAWGDTHFIYAEEDSELLHGNRRYPLYAGMYASAPGSCLFSGRGIVVSREDWLGFFHLGGPVEHHGRLKYIDGCTDSLLVPPVRFGDPCLNLLYFPPDIDQTAHTHPSDRIGMILSGRGRCHAWRDEDGEEETIDLIAGMVFCIHTDGRHKFSTPYGLDMRVLAYHPESDFGPRDEDHPMINRTIVDGTSAAKIDAIRTR